MDEAAFQRCSGEAITRLYQRLGRASERHDFEADFNNGALTVEFEDPPARFVVSPNSPVRQIWVSANVKSFKLDWNEAAGDFVLAATGEDLASLMAAQIEKHLGEPVSL